MKKIRLDISPYMSSPLSTQLAEEGVDFTQLQPDEISRWDKAAEAIVLLFEEELINEKQYLKSKRKLLNVVEQRVSDKIIR